MPTFFKNSPLNEMTYLDSSLMHWLSALIGATAFWMLIRFVQARLVSNLEKSVPLSDTKFDDGLLIVLKKTQGIFLFIICFFLMSKFLGFSVKASLLLHKFLVVAMFFQAALWGNELVGFGLSRYLKRRGHGEQSEVHLSAYSAVSITAKFVLWSVLFLLLLDNLGVNITALVTGLGIGGIAIALAVQNILGDIFASLTIVLDRPFEVGDFIVVDGSKGTVESIGLKTSRIKSLSGEQLVFPNKKLVESQIQNFKQMQTRRIVFGFGVLYDSTYEQLEKIPEIVRQILGRVPEVVLDRVHLQKFGESSIDYEVVYIMQVPDYNVYMDAQQTINLALFKEFAAQGIEFAFPTRTVLIRNSSMPKPSGEAEAADPILNLALRRDDRARGEPQ